MSTGYLGIGQGPTSSIYTETAERLEWPDPDMSMRTAPEPDKAAVPALVALAEACGWKAWVTEAVGAWPTIGGRPSRQRRSLAVRMARNDRVAVAVYVEGLTEGVSWSWDTLASINSGWLKFATIGEFQDHVFGPLCKPSWPTNWACPYFGPVHGPDKPKRVRSKASDPPC